jgi:hypothetical protein
LRNYWLRIALGALAIFTVGMVGRALIQRGVGNVRGVVEGSGPVSIPLAFIPFQLAGDKLGTLNRVTFQRTTPTHVTSVRLEVKLNDSLLARGLEGCRLAANIDSKRSGGEGINIERGPFPEGNFWCVGEDTAEADLVEYGEAVFHPGDVTVPLLLPEDLVDELQNLDFGGGPTEAPSEAQLESIIEADVAAELRADSMRTVPRGMLDSLRKEGLRRADSARQAVIRMADSTPRR